MHYCENALHMYFAHGDINSDNYHYIPLYMAHYVIGLVLGGGVHTALLCMLHTTGASCGNHEYELFRVGHGAGEEVRASNLTMSHLLHSVLKHAGIKSCACSHAHPCRDRTTCSSLPMQIVSGCATVKACNDHWCM